MVATDPTERDRIVDEWDRRGIDVPLKILDSPYREIIRPIVEYAKAIREAQPRGVVAVFIPEYVVGRWWEQLLHNQTALRLKTRLLFTPGRDGHLGALPAPVLADRRGARRAAGGAGHRPPLLRVLGRPGRRGAGLDEHASHPGEGPARPAPSSGRAPRGRGRRRGARRPLRRPAGRGRARGRRHGRLRPARLPGERVVVRLTEGAAGDRFLRGDAVEVLEASPDRVEAPCRYAGPGRCGGCDLQHVDLAAQRAAQGPGRGRAAAPAGRPGARGRGRGGARRRARAALADPDAATTGPATARWACAATGRAWWSPSRSA